MAEGRFRLTVGKVVLLLLVVGVALYAIFFVQDWHQLWRIASAPDNIAIVALIPLVAFFTWLGIKQAQANDRLVVGLGGVEPLAKTHHRRTLPWRAGCAREIPVWA